MSNKQHYKDLNRDPNPANVPPPEQVDEQGLKTKPVPDKGQTATRRPGKKAPARAVKGEFHSDQELNPATEITVTQDENPAPANVLLRVTDSSSGTIHDEAERQSLRQNAGALPTPTESASVEGHELEVFAAPEVLHPIEVPAHKRDTLIKDALRASGDPDKVAKADAPVHTPQGGDWHTEIVFHEGKILPPRQRKPNRRETPKKPQAKAQVKEPKAPRSPAKRKPRPRARGKRK